MVAGFDSFEDSRNVIKNADYKDLKAFVADFLNTPDKKQRRKLAEEFRRRHFELHQFIKENADLINAKAEISKIVTNTVNGSSAETENSEISNLFKVIEEGLDK